jgi:hypothetical protein
MPGDRTAALATQPVSTGAQLTVLLWVAVACLLGTVNADPDLWGHLRFGLDMLRDHSLPATDPYSYSQDIPWINHEWLSELQMGVAYTLGGVPGLFALRTAIFGIACGVLAWHLRRLPFLARAGAVVITMWAAVPIASSLRPQVWSYAAIALVAALLTTTTRPRRLLWLPVVFMLWVNLHGGWIVGGLLVGIWAIVRVREERWRRWAIAISVLSAAATLVNPYGLDMWQFLLRTVRVGRDAQEWHPLTAAPLRDWWPWLITFVTPLALATRHRLEAHRILTIVVLAFLSFRVVRLVPMFALVTAIYIAPVLAAVAQRLGGLSWKPVAPSRTAAALTLIPIVAVTWMFFPVTAASCFPVRGAWIPEPVTARSLQLADPSGKLVTEFGWGEYAIWHFGPHLRVAMDGRRETVYSDATLTRYDRMMEAHPDGLKLLVEHQPEYVWAPSTRAALKSWLLEHGYRIDVDGTGAWVAVRRDLPIVQVAEAPARQCFPG